MDGRELNPRRWARLPKWEELPVSMRNEEVRPYYDALKRHWLGLKMKRLFDVLAGIVLLIICAIPMCIIAIAVKADSKGPVFYRQERVTTYGRKFRIHKFRTMVADADRLGSAITVSGDARITKVGKKLRGLRLDELPQLFDVIEGNMSFVGTRPEVEKYVNCYTPEMMATLLLPAGITSEASIRYKDEAGLLDTAEDVDKVYVEQVLPEKMKWNLESIERFKFLRDVLTMFRTVTAVLGKDYR